MPEISLFNQFENYPKQNISEEAVEMQAELYSALRNNDSFTILMKNPVQNKKVKSVF